MGPRNLEKRPLLVSARAPKGGSAFPKKKNLARNRILRYARGQDVVVCRPNRKIAPRPVSPNWPDPRVTVGPEFEQAGARKKNPSAMVSHMPVQTGSSAT